MQDFLTRGERCGLPTGLGKQLASLVGALVRTPIPELDDLSESIA